MSRLFKTQLVLLLTVVVISDHVRSSDLIEVLPATDRIIMLHFDDGSVDYHDQLGQQWGDDTFVNNPIDGVAVMEPATYTISSPDDGHYAGPLNPVQVGKKSKSMEMPGIWPDYPYIKEHWVYLELPHAMQRSKTYTVHVGTLAANVDQVSLTFDEFENRSETVHVNQIGFVPSARLKYAYVYHWMGTFGAADLSSYAGRPFHLVDTSSGAVAYTGQVAFRKSNSVECFHGDRYYNSDVWECDFSSFSQPGEYRVVVEGIGCSFPFSIDNDAYHDAFYTAVRGLYHQRSGPARGAPYSSHPKPEDHMPGVNGHKVYYSTFRWMDRASQDDIFVQLVATATTTEMPNAWGGWMDAADFDRMPTHLGIVNQLLMIYEFAPEKYTDGQLNIPESGNGIPDIIDECRFEVDFFLRIKGPTGGISSGLETSAHPDAGTTSWTDAYKTWYQYGESTLVSFWTAACSAQLAHCLTLAGRSDLSPYYVNEAIAAYNWAQSNLQPGDLDKEHCRDKRMLAAAWLFKMTGEMQYQDQYKLDNRVTTSTSELDNYSGPEGYNQEYAVWTFVTTDQPGIDQSLKDVQIQATLNWAMDENVGMGSSRACRMAHRFDLPTVIGMGASTPLIMPLIAAHAVSGDETYRDYIYTTCDYYLGGNPINTVMMTGVGERRVKHVMSHDGWYDGVQEPIPGIVPYAYVHVPFVGDWWGTWAPGYHYLSCEPDHGEWPINEKYFDARYCPMLGEFTIWQNIGPSAAAYGYLIGGEAQSLPAPTGFVVTPLTGSSINLTWLDNAVNEDGYLVQRKTGGDWQTIADLPPNSSSYLDQENIYGQVVYTYRVGVYRN